MKIAPSTQRAIEILESLEFGEYLTGRQLAKRVGVNMSMIVKSSKQEPLLGHKIAAPKRGAAAQYVNKKTMEEFKNETEKR